MKKDIIYQKLHHDIISGIWREGDQLPTEMESMKLFNVSRDTVRSAYKRLEDEGYLERIKAKGAFVRLPKPSPEERNIYLLVPCEEYLQNSVIHFQRLFFELIAQAALIGWRITPIIFSRTNSNQDIWWENLQHFNAESRIIINRFWYAPYFPTAQALKCRIAFIRDDGEIPRDYVPYTRSWMNFIESDRSAIQQAISYFQRHHCHRVAIAIPHVDDSGNTFAAACRQELQSHGMEGVFLDTDQENFCLNIAQRMKEDPFDAMVTHCDETKLNKRMTFRDNLGLPENFPVIALPLRDDGYYLDEPIPIPILEYPLRELAKSIISELTQVRYQPQQFTFIPHVVVHQKNEELL